MGATAVELRAGEILFTEGSRGELIYRIEDGEIVVSRGERALRAFGAGDVFGEMGPVFQLPRSATARARVPTRLTGFTVGEFGKQFGGEELRRLVGRYTAG
jgi:putative ABC transport system ATP-binding protein